MTIKTLVMELIDRAWDFEIKEDVLYMMLGNEAHAIHIYDDEALNELYSEMGGN